MSEEKEDEVNNKMNLEQMYFSLHPKKRKVNHT